VLVKIGDMKKIVTLSSILICVLLMIFFAYQFRVERTLSIEIVGNLSDDEGIAKVTGLTVKLSNHGSSSVEPRFSVVAGEYPYYWDIESGPEILGAGQSAIYVLHADHIDKGIPDKQPFIVRVNDVHSSVYFSSRPMTLHLETLPLIANSKFKFWMIDHGTGMNKPSGWEASPLVSWGAKAYTSHEVVDNENVLKLTVKKDVSSSDWATMQVKQIIKFSNKTIGIMVYPTFSYEGGSEPKDVYGIEINDGIHMIWYVFSDVNEGTYTVSAYHSVWVIKTPLNEWSYREINFTQRYQELSWEMPRYVYFTCIVGTRLSGTYSGYFRGIAT